MTGFAGKGRKRPSTAQHFVTLPHYETYDYLNGIDPLPAGEGTMKNLLPAQARTIGIDSNSRLSASTPLGK